MNKAILTIVCPTYNHEKYIKQALDSMLTQKTTFEFEILIHDDASTDNTSSLIKEYASAYPKIIKPIIQTVNQHSRGIRNADIIYPLIKTKYIAICEGDDYWTDPLKLQKQVDFLEANPDYSICWGGYSELHMSNNQLIKPQWKDELVGDHEINLENVFSPYCTLTLTALFRSNCLNTVRINEFNHFRDNTIYIQCLTQGKGYLINSDFGVYRIHEGGVYSALSDFEKSSSSYLNIREALSKINGSRSKNLVEIKKQLIKMTLERLPKKLFYQKIHFLYFGMIELGIVGTSKIMIDRFSKRTKS
jgi:glycosyltransferase involved in cell wall biosynthesis